MGVERFGSIDNDSARDYILTYVATDDSDNVKSATRTVTVRNSPDVPSEHGDITKAQARKNGKVKITYADNATLMVDAFSGNAKPKVRLTRDNDRVIVIKKNGTKLKVFDASGNQIASKKLRKAKQTVTKFNVWNFYSASKDNIVVATQKNDILRTTTLTLTTAGKLKHKQTKKFQPFVATNFQLKKKKHKIRILENDVLVVAYKLKKNGDLE